MESQVARTSMEPGPFTLVVTTIARPTAAMRAHSEQALAVGAKIVVAGDEKGPDEFSLDGATFLNVEEQRLFSPLGTHLPTGSYTRKNIGYLWAIGNGARVIVETDDDNTPTSGFYRDRSQQIKGRLVEHPPWFNAYQIFSESDVWPRGFPLERIRDARHDVSYEHLPESTDFSPIQQGLADGDPDVDAIYRMTRELPVRFKRNRTIFLAPGTWCPFNSQNTTWFRDAFPLLYLPSLCSFRMTDIWRSFVAQRIGWANGWSIAFSSPDVSQERNDHDLLADFSDEISGYLNNVRIATRLESLDLPKGNIGESMTLCYQALVSMNVVGGDELRLLQTWLDELERLQTA